MNIRNIDLNLLHVFVTVYDCKSITLAAKKLHLSQPAISNAITRLNSALGMTLFVKNNRAIAPSRHADDLYLDIKYCLQKIELTLCQRSRFDPATSERTFRIATSNYGEIALFTKLAPHIEHFAPNIKIVREFFPVDDFSQYLQDGQLDLGLFFDRPNVKGIHKEFLFNDPLVLITGCEHPPLPDKLGIEDIVNLDFISLKNECNNFDFLCSAFNNHSDYRAPRFTVATMWSMFFIVSTTKLAAVSPLLYAKTLEKHLPIKIHHLTGVEKIELNLYWRDIETEDPGHRWLRELIKYLLLQDKP
jgi:DNA-binding transcriptional LysR family regulator